MTTGEWYFHGSGLDITFGSDNEYGGILIQAIREIEPSQHFISGPLNVVTTIFENLGSIDVNSTKFWIGPYNRQPEKIISASRVGLNAKTVGVDFSKGFRFLIFPKEAHARKIDIINHLVSTSQMSLEEAKSKIYK